jgi:beta-galactosidase/beta-glucuronidase
MPDDRPLLHPRPQRARAGWIDLCGPWDFAYDDEGRGLDERWQERADVFNRQITVPFPPESPASGIGDTAYHPVVWYRRSIEVPARRENQRAILHCGAVDYRAQVWVNGHVVATHEGGHTPFSADITPALDDGPATVVIRAEDPPLDMALPRGKQEWRAEPHNIWYYRTTGIWQPVWLEIVDATHILDVRWTPDVERGLLGVQVALQHPDPDPVQVRIRVSLRSERLADVTATVRGGELRLDLPLEISLYDNVRSVLWSPNYPNLLDATLTVLREGEPIDEVTSYTGLRSVSIAGGRLLINGRPQYLRMALEQGYWPESHLAAPSVDAMRREVELAKELGFNGIRIHQKVEDPRFLYWCDRLGLLVWGEMANAYVFSRTAVERLTREWLEVLARDYSHPCIVAWVPLNESWGVPNLRIDPAQRHYVQMLYHLTKTLDPTRPVIGNDGWEHLVGDIFGIHDYTFEGADLRQRYGSTAAIERTIAETQPQNHLILLQEQPWAHQPIMITEFGGISLKPGEQEDWYGYGTVGTAEEFLAKYQELVEAVLASPIVAGFCYTQLTDTLQETNGLLTADRTPKVDPARIRAITRGYTPALPTEALERMRAAVRRRLRNDDLPPMSVNLTE